MRINRTYLLALGVALLACALPAGVAAETADSTNVDKYAALEARIAQLEAQLNQKPAAMAQAAEAPAAAPAEATPPPAAPAPPPDPLAALKSVFGGVTFTGLVDTYYGYNANHPPRSTGTTTEPFSFRRDAFGLNLVELQLDKPVDKSAPLGFRVALGFGDTINAVNEGSFLSASSGGDGDQSGTQYLKEAYLSYMAPIGKGLQFDFGKWVTPAGAEVIETNQNWNYSRSLMFYDAIPFYHFGARVKYTFNGKWSAAGYAANGWNNVVSTNSGKTGGFTLAYNPTKKTGISINYLAGPRDSFTPIAPITFLGDSGHWNNLADVVVTYNPTGKLSLMANFDYDHQDLGAGHSFDYTAGAGYVKYQATPKVAVAVRGEYFNDHDGIALPGATPQHMWETTGTLERTFASHLIARAEYRHDESNRNVFGSGGPNLGPPTSFLSHQDTAKIGLVFVLAPAQ